MADDKKKELPSCVAFGMRYWKRVRAKLDKIGCDWMTPKVQRDWFLAGLTLTFCMVWLMTSNVMITGCLCVLVISLLIWFRPSILS